MSYTGAIHIYGGDFVGTRRSQWDVETLQEQPYDLNAVHQEFDRAERAFRPGNESGTGQKLPTNPIRCPDQRDIRPRTWLPLARDPFAIMTLGNFE
jgi:hypothetical protein